MKPIDTPPRDWGLYFNGTWMLHKEHGVVYVRASREYLECETDSLQYRCDPRDLSPLWPAPKAVNIRRSSRACYVGRTSVREARRSATNHHYFIAWGRGSGITRRHMIELVCNDRYPSIDLALHRLTRAERPWASIAVSRDFILNKRRNGSLEVIFRAQQAFPCTISEGHIEPKGGPIGPLQKRALAKLQKEGLAWH
jgi:hypothetical protein